MRRATAARFARTSAPAAAAVLATFGYAHEYRWDVPAKYTLTSGKVSATKDVIDSEDLAQATAGNRPVIAAGPPDYLDFSGGAHNLTVASALSLSSDFSIACYVDTTAIPNDGGLHVFACLLGTGGGKFELGYFPTGTTTGLAVFRMTSDGGGFVQLVPSLSRGKATLVATLHGSNIELSVSGGTLTSTAKGSITSASAGLTIGTDSGGSSSWPAKGANIGTKASTTNQTHMTAIHTAYAAIY